MQNIQESGIGVTRHLSNLGLVDQCLVEQIGSIGLFSIFFFLIVCAALCIFGFLFLGNSARDVKAHLDELISPSGGFSPSVSGTALLMPIDPVRS